MAVSTYYHAKRVRVGKTDGPVVGATRRRIAWVPRNDRGCGNAARER